VHQVGLSLLNYIETHGQQNIKLKGLLFPKAWTHSTEISSCSSFFSFPLHEAIPNALERRKYDQE